jgi:SulP family sulfate permease
MNSPAPGRGASLRRFLPVSVWLPVYRRAWLAVDLAAALTVWALVVPEAMAYASLAGMPPETGLYAALVAPLAYAIFGTSRQLNVGPSSSVAALSAAIVAPLAVAGDPALFGTLTVGLALLVGIVFITAGLVRLGFLADFMSRPVLDGFIVGLALTIAAGQLHKLLGIDTSGGEFFEDLAEVVRGLGDAVPATVAIGLGSLIALFALEALAPRVPAALVVTASAIVLVSVTGLADQGVAVIGAIPARLPSLTWPELSPGQWASLVPGALGIVIVGFGESIAAARSYARKYGYEVDADQEMFALGAASLGAGLAGSFTVDGSLSKTAAADQAGQRTQLASFVVVAAVFLTILFLTGLFEQLPEATLGAIVIHAVWHLIDLGRVGRFWTLRRADFWPGLVALAGVLVLGILLGLLVAIAVSFLLVLARATRPSWGVLGRVADERTGEVVYRRTAAHADARTIPGLVIVRFDAELFFANANVFAAAVRSSLADAPQPVRVVLIDAESVNDIDATAMAVLRELDDELRGASIELWFARLKASLEASMARFGIDSGGRRYPSVERAVIDFEARFAAG